MTVSFLLSAFGSGSVSTFVLVGPFATTPSFQVRSFRRVRSSHVVLHADCLCAESGGFVLFFFSGICLSGSGRSLFFLRLSKSLTFSVPNVLSFAREALGFRLSLGASAPRPPVAFLLREGLGFGLAFGLSFGEGTAAFEWIIRLCSWIAPSAELGEITFAGKSCVWIMGGDFAFSWIKNYGHLMYTGLRSNGLGKYMNFTQWIAARYVILGYPLIVIS